MKLEAFDEKRLFYLKKHDSKNGATLSKRQNSSRISVYTHCSCYIMQESEPLNKSSKSCLLPIISQLAPVHIPNSIPCDIHSCTRRWARCLRPRHPPCRGSSVEVEGSSEASTRDRVSVNTAQWKLTIFVVYQEWICCHFCICMRCILTHRWTKRHHGRPGRRYRSMSMTTWSSASALVEGTNKNGLKQHTVISVLPTTQGS